MRTTLILAGLALALAGCNQADAPADTAATAQVEPAGTPADPSAGAPAPVAGAGFRHDAEIPRGQIDTNLVLAVPPAYRPSDDSLLLQVEVQNRGKTPLVGQGEMPVQLAATLAGPDGVDKAPGRRDFVRVRLPLVQPGASSTVGVRIPAEEILGLAVKLELVQEHVGWFGKRYGQPVLDAGVFQRCDGGEQTLCDSGGVPVRTINGQGTAPADAPAG